MIDLKERLLPQVRKHVAGVPDAVCKQSIAEGLHRFLVESEVWTEKQVISAFAHEVLIDADEPLALVANVADAKTMDGRSLRCRYTRGLVEFPVIPEQDVVIEVVLMNDQSSGFAPNWLLNRYSGAVVHAAVQELKTQFSQPWFDPDGAMFHEREYAYDLGNARVAAMPKLVKFTPFA